MHHPGTTETKRMLDEVCLPAMQAVADELMKRGVEASVEQNCLKMNCRFIIWILLFI